MLAPDLQHHLHRHLPEVWVGSNTSYKERSSATQTSVAPDCGCQTSGQALVEINAGNGGVLTTFYYILCTPYYEQ
jgi:hypothetical protein